MSGAKKGGSGLTVLHHHSEELDDDFGARPDDHLALVALLRVVDRLERVGEYVHVHHGGCSTSWLCARTRESEISIARHVSQ